MKKIAKKTIWIISILAVLCLVLILICNQIVINNAKGKAFSDIDSIKYNNRLLMLRCLSQGEPILLL